MNFWPQTFGFKPTPSCLSLPEVAGEVMGPWDVLVLTTLSQWKGKLWKRPIANFHQWIFQVPVKGGRDYITP